MLDDILRESSFAAALRDLWIEEGMEKGLEEGRVEATRQLSRMALEERFGALSADMLTALETVDEATLQAVVVHLANESLPQVRQRLGLPPE